jgi:hypothetical protein
MVLPVNNDWKCCKTCEHWGGDRRFTSFGLVADYSPMNSIEPCSRKQNSVSQHRGQCPYFELWQGIAERQQLFLESLQGS